MSYFAVFDGHNGSRVSKLASQQLHNIIFAQFPPGTHTQSLELCAISIMVILSMHSNTICVGRRSDIGGGAGRATRAGGLVQEAGRGVPARCM